MNGFSHPKLADNPLFHNQAFIDGEWVSAESGQLFDVADPATQHVLEHVPDMGVVDTERAIAAANKAQTTWAKSTLKSRSELLKKLHRLISNNLENLAHIISLESGKTLADSKGEINKANIFHEWFSEEVKRIKGDCIMSVQKSDSQMLCVKQAIGVAALITPWNSPLQMITRKSAAALAAGCCVVVKPAEDTPLTALALAHLVHGAGFAPGVFNVVTCSRANAKTVCGVLCESHVVRKLSFTGSVEAGKWLYANCSQTVKKMSLELGGNAAFIVCESADIDSAVQAAMGSKFRNSGQTCICANRILVHESVYDQFCDKMEQKVKEIRLGHPLCPKTTMGPLINHRAIEKVQRHVDDAIEQGGVLRAGGKVDAELGPLFFQPTLVVDVPKSAQVHKEETFGPFAAVTKFKTDEEAIETANTVEAGLASYVYTRDFAQALRFTKELQVGMLGVNEIAITPEQVPFGGIKESGLGREGSVYGIEEYLEMKSFHFNMNAFLK